MSEAARAFLDAARLLRAPRRFYADFSFEAPLAPDLRLLAFWGILAGLLDTLLILIGYRAGESSAVIHVTTVLLGPIVFLALVAALAALYWAALRLLGGTANYRVAYRAIACAGPLFTLEILLAPLLVFRLALMGFKFYLAAVAAEEVFAVGRRRASWVFGLLGASFVGAEVYRVFF